DQVLPLVRSRIGGLNHHHFFVGGIAIGDQIEGGSLIVDHIGVRIGIPLYGDQVGIGIPEVLEKQFVARGGDRGRDKEVVFILGDPPAHIAVFFLRCPAEDQLVLGLGRAHFVVVQFVLVGLGRKFTAFGLVITGIEEAIVPFPGNAAEFYVHQGILHNFLGGRIDHDALSPITAPLGNQIGRPRSVLGEAQAHQGGGTVLGEGIGVQKDLFGIFPLGPVYHILVLKAVVPVVVGI